MKPVAGAINSLVNRLRDARERELSFVADAAHELRTPLAGIKLHAGTIRVERSVGGGALFVVELSAFNVQPATT
jgi:two-component system sensor histidine kinase QseC